MSGFANPIIGGGGALVYPSIHSPNYVPAVSGWTIRKDGSAEFNNGVFRGTVTASEFDGTDFIINSNGAFFYAGTPGPTTLITAIVAGPVNDPFGTPCRPGVNVTNIGGTNFGELVVGVVDPNTGDTVSGTVLGALEVGASRRPIIEMTSGAFSGGAPTTLSLWGRSIDSTVLEQFGVLGITDISTGIGTGLFQMNHEGPVSIGGGGDLTVDGSIESGAEIILDGINLPVGGRTGQGVISASLAGRLVVNAPSTLQQNLSSSDMAIVQAGSSGSTSFTTLASDVILANDAIPGAVYEFVVFGYGTQGSTVQSPQFAALFNALSTGTGITFPTSFAAASAALPWKAVITLICVTTGVAGTWLMDLEISILQSHAVAHDTTTVVADTTVNQAIAIQGRWNATAGGPILTSRRSYLKRVA